MPSGQMTFRSITVMRLTRSQIPLLAVLILAILGSTVFSQNEGRQKRKMSSKDFWAKFAGDKDSVNVSELPPSQRRDRWQAFLEKKGVTNGIMTKEPFEELLVDLRNQMKSGGGPGGTGGFGRFKMGPKTDKQPDSPASSESDNKETPPAATVVVPSRTPTGEDSRPTVYRLGKMPKDLPSWFEQLDTDKDGQVGLYEWKKAGRNVDEFLAMDANKDGFLTAEEVLRHQRARGLSASASTVATASPGQQGSMRRGGGFSRPRFSPGGNTPSPQP
jgi:hypothetical protein